MGKRLLHSVPVLAGAVIRYPPSSGSKVEGFTEKVPLSPEHHGNLPQKKHEAIYEMVTVIRISILPRHANSFE